MTRATAALVEIMIDKDAPLRRRIEAAESLLAYEAPEEAVEQAKAFLAAVFEDADQHVDDRLDAVKLVRKAEARKSTQPTPSPDERANRELWRRHDISRRRAELMGAGLWPPPAGWDADLMSEDYIAPALRFRFRPSRSP